jgi:hypothetical protein
LNDAVAAARAAGASWESIRYGDRRDAAVGARTRGCAMTTESPASRNELAPAELVSPPELRSAILLQWQ